ncbi:MAG: hypothetical protein KF764_11345 [Labilithrix sp.]|nr:hypothetical protein [Labilithrix sp.]
MPNTGKQSALEARVRDVIARRTQPVTEPGEKMVVAALRIAGKDGLTVSEVAEVLGEHQSTVWGRMRRLRASGRVVSTLVLRVRGHAPFQVWTLA